MKYLVGLLVAVIVGGAGVAFLYHPQAAEPQAGGASSPNIVNGCMELGAGGVTLCSYRQPMVNASSTCSFRPAASSTLLYAAARLTNVYAGTFDVEFGKATNAFSTTTSVGRIASVSGPITINASTTAQFVGNDNTLNFGANQFLNIKVGSSSPTVAGTCTAVFLTI